MVLDSKCCVGKTHKILRNDIIVPFHYILPLDDYLPFGNSLLGIKVNMELEEWCKPESLEE